MTEQGRIVRPEEVEERRLAPSHQWIGSPAEVRRLGAALGWEGVAVNYLWFEPGTRSRPHSHAHDQLLYYVSGTGVVAFDGGEDQLVQAGEFVVLPAHVPHMHGAFDGGPAVHISLIRDPTTDFDCAIPEAWRRWREEK